MYFWENTLFRGRTNSKPMDTFLWQRFLGIISFFMSSLLRFYRLNNCEKNVLAGAWREFGAMKNPLCFCEDKNCVTCQSFFTPYSTWSKSLEMLFRKLPSLKHANNQSCTAKLLMTGLGRENSNVFQIEIKVLKIEIIALFDL